jgi:hypothetical protein
MALVVREAGERKAERAIRGSKRNRCQPVARTDSIGEALDSSRFVDMARSDPDTAG